MFQHCERLGLDRVKHDLLWTRGVMFVGGTQEQQEYAWQWLRMKEGEQAKAQGRRDDVIMFKPAIWGVGLNLNELWRRLRCWFRKT